jgi:HD-like signal output (HDOD) protein
MSAIATPPVAKPSTPATPSTPNGEALIAEALGKLTTIGTLPEVTARIIKTVEDPRSSAGQLHEIVSHDPALVTRILKVVNSSFYGLPGQIGSIERAIVLLGLNGVKNLAVAASLGQLFRGVKLCEPFGARDLWVHCVAVGVAAKELALHLRLPVADEAFLAGMIHDVGLLAHVQLWPEKLRQVCEEAKLNSGEEFCAIEQRIIGMDHAQLGCGLAHRWRFPQRCQQVAALHHHPAEPGEDRLLVGLVRVADTLCCQLNQGFNLTALNQKIEENELNNLGLNHAAFEEVTQVLPDKIAAAADIFG